MPTLTYEDLVAVVRKHSDFKFQEGFRTYGTIDSFADSHKLPRQLLRETLQRSHKDEGYGDILESNRDPTAGLYDLYALGMERVLMRVLRGQARYDADLDKGYEVEMIGAFNERMGFKYLGDETPQAHETLFDAIEEARYVTDMIHHDDEYLLIAHGMNTVEVATLVAYPAERIRVYHISIFEGEGWWGTFTFAVRAEFYHR
jgi:hypothetical protein